MCLLMDETARGGLPNSPVRRLLIENTGPQLPGKPRGVAARDHRAATPTPNNTGVTRFGLSPSPILALPQFPYEPRILALNCADALDHRVQRSIGQKPRFVRGPLA